MWGWGRVELLTIVAGCTTSSRFTENYGAKSCVHDVKHCIACLPGLLHKGTLPRLCEAHNYSYASARYCEGWS
jgi:hypothetical protein